jgi:hypothetical protein
VRVFVCLVWLSLVGIAGCTTAPPAGAPVAERPTYVIGDRWIRDDGTFVMTRIEDDAYVFVGAGRQIRLTRDLALARVQKGRWFVEMSPPVRLTWPLRVGAWGQTDTVWRWEGNPSGVAGRLVWEVEAYEDVIPGGALGPMKAFRIALTAETGGGAWRKTLRLWYAPDAQRFVKGEGPESRTTMMPIETFAVIAMDGTKKSTPMEQPRTAMLPPGPPAAPADQEPPRVIVESPAVEARVGTESVELVARIIDDVGLARVEVAVTGPTGRQARELSVAGPEHTVREVMHLAPGSNLVELTAIDTAGNVTNVSRRVVYDRALPQASRLTDLGALYRSSWAVVIGINEYRHVQVPKLRYAVNDARAVERALLAQGFARDRVIVITDAEATKTRIEEVLGDELRQRVGPDDRVLVFFAGHGKTDRLRSGEDEGYLLPVDGDPARLFATSISMTALRQVSDRLRARHILFVVDACYSGYAIFNRAISDDLLEELVRKPAIQILTAGRQEDQAQERDGHGVFTQVLLRGLEGEVFRGKPWVALEELGIWVKQRVYAESNRKQVPQYGSLSGEGQFVFVRPAREDAR